MPLYRDAPPCRISVSCHPKFDGDESQMIPFAIQTIANGIAFMTQPKSALMSLRMTPQGKALLALCAQREHRSMASMMEHMVHTYAASHGIALPAAEPELDKNTTKKL